MNEEIIIRQEAKEFWERKINRSQQVEAIDDFHELKRRLQDFYSDESKALFLDEVKNLIVVALKKHRDDAHGGQPGVNCRYEKKPDKLVFYINQELGTLPIVAHQRSKNNATQERSAVFVSYSHYDREF